MKTLKEKFRASFHSSAGQMDFKIVVGDDAVRKALREWIRNTPYFADGDKFVVKSIDTD